MESNAPELPCPGEKMEVARQLARLKVDVIEAGFPVISDGDFSAVQTIAQEIKGPTIAGLGSVSRDIEAAGRAVSPAGSKGRIHVFQQPQKFTGSSNWGRLRTRLFGWR